MIFFETAKEANKAGYYTAKDISLMPNVTGNQNRYTSGVGEGKVKLGLYGSSAVKVYCLEDVIAYVAEQNQSAPVVVVDDNGKSMRLVAMSAFLATHGIEMDTKELRDDCRNGTLPADAWVQAQNGAYWLWTKPVLAFYQALKPVRPATPERQNVRMPPQYPSASNSLAIEVAHLRNELDQLKRKAAPVKQQATKMRLLTASEQSKLTPALEAVTFFNDLFKLDIKETTFVNWCSKAWVPAVLAKARLSEVAKWWVDVHNPALIAYVKDYPRRRSAAAARLLPGTRISP